MITGKNERLFCFTPGFAVRVFSQSFRFGEGGFEFGVNTLELIGINLPAPRFVDPFERIVWSTPISQLVILASQICDIFRLTL
jgi:hypothetical protein